MGLYWLMEVFNQNTKRKANLGKELYLLILNSYGSYISMAFLEYAMRHNIHIAVLPPYSTHWLQPLDISLFAPLSQRYSQKLDERTLQSGGLSSMSKRIFLKLFWPAYEAAFSSSNIESGWLKTGLEPQDPGQISKQLVKPKAQNQPTTSSRVPEISQTI